MNEWGDHIEGQLFATHAAIRALLETHPNRDAASKAIEANVEKITAISLGKTWSDAFLAGIEKARKAMWPKDRG